MVDSKMTFGPPGSKEADLIPLSGPWDYKIELELEPKNPTGDRGPKPRSKQSEQSQRSYNAMIAPLTPFGIRGAIWYQGESNAGRAYQYRTLFPTMIRTGAERGARATFLSSLCNWLLATLKPDPGESEWAELREAQNVNVA